MFAAESQTVGALLASVDLNRVLDPQTPVTVECTGNIGGFGTFHETVENAIGQELAKTPLPIASVAVTWSGALSASYSVEIVARSTDIVKTPWGVQYHVSAAVARAAGAPIGASSVTHVGRAKEIITPKAPEGSMLDRLVGNVETVGTVIKWLAILVLIGLVVYLAVSSGAFGAVRAAVA